MGAADLVRRFFEQRGVDQTVSFQTVFGRALDLDTWPSTRAGKAVTADTALQVSAVYACVTLLSDSISTLPLDTYRRKADGSRAEFTKPTWLEFRHGALPKIDFLNATMSSLLLDGNAYWLVFRDGKGNVQKLDVLDPKMVDVRRDVASELPTYTVNGQRLVYGMDIFHVRGFLLPGEVKGASPVTHARETIGAALAVNEYGAAFFGNGALPGLVVESPVAMTEQAVKLMKSQWNALHKGSGNAAKLAVLTEGAKASKISVDPEEAQFLQTKGFMVADIARLFRVPPHLIGDASGSTSWGSGLKEQSTAFVQHSLRPWIERIERALTDLMLLDGAPQQAFVKLNVDALMRGDYETRFNVYSTAVTQGILTINEVRAFEDMPPVEWGDKPQSVQLQEDVNGEPPDDGGGGEPPNPPVEEPPSGDGERFLRSLLDWMEERFDEGKHPRDRKGRFTSGKTGGVFTKDVKAQIDAGLGEDAEHPIRVTKAEDAIAPLAAGKHVVLPEREVGTLVSDLSDVANRAKAAGSKAPDYDLCKVSVPSTNLFCAQSVGVARIDMPQLKGKPRPGSAAAKKAGGDLTKEVSVEDEFKERLRADGHRMSNDTVDASYLKASQNELVGTKVGGMMRAAEDGKLDLSQPIFVSRDNYILDGHHRWAAAVGQEYHEGHAVMMNVVRVDMPITELLDYSNRFAGEMGILQKSGSSAVAGRSLETPCNCKGLENRWDPQQPRGKDGKWSALNGPLSLGWDELPEGLRNKMVAKIEDTFGMPEAEVAAQMQANLDRLMEQASPEHLNWYPEKAAEIAAVADEIGMPKENLVAMVSATSAQKRWVENVGVAERAARVLKNDEPFELTQADIDDHNAFAAKRKKGKVEQHDDLVPGTYKPSELPSDVVATHAPGMPRLKNTDYMVNAVDIYRGDRDTIDAVIQGPKQRSFVNNFMDPDDPRFVTVDTWHYRATVGDMPLTATVKGTTYTRTLPEWESATVAKRSAQDFFQSSPASVADGWPATNGVYPYFVHQTQIAAERYGVPPHSLQAMAWYVVGGGQ